LSAEELRTGNCLIPLLQNCHGKQCSDFSCCITYRSASRDINFTPVYENRSEKNKKAEITNTSQATISLF
jgi:hypothetical protein